MEINKQLEDTREKLNADLFNRYLNWVEDNNLKDTSYNYYLYVTNIEKFYCGIFYTN